MKSKSTLVLIYNSFGDPLFQNLVLSYIKTLAKKVDHTFHLVTFEQEKHLLDPDEKDKILQELAASGIIWSPLKFHTGKFLLFWKAWDFLNAFWTIFRLKYRFGFKTIFCFANVSASIGIVLKKIFNLKMIVYSYEPHCDFMVDLGHWKRQSLKYRILHFLENWAGRESEFIMTGTRHMVEHLHSVGAKGEIIRAPTAVDGNQFFFNTEARYRLRSELKLASEKVFLYVGKFGGLYYTSAVMATFFEQVKNTIEDAYFIVITSNDQKEVMNDMAQKLPADSYYVTGNLSYTLLKDFLSASDIGLSGVPPSPSQKYRSPTKVAEYLLTGLPYITTDGVAEDDWYAAKYNVGIVVDSFHAFDSEKHTSELNALLDEDKETLRRRCREVGLEYRSKSWIDEQILRIYGDL